MTGVLDDPSMRTVVRADTGVSDEPGGRPPAVWPVLLSRVLTAFALSAGWALLYVYVLSGFEAAHEQKGLYELIRTRLAQGEVPIAGPIAVGTPVAVMDIPALHTGSVVVVEGTSAEQLQRAPGHYRTTVLPGQTGISTLYGRSASFGGPFGGIETLAIGARIDVTTGQGRFEFVVTGIRHKGDEAPAAPQQGHGRLTLVTSAGSLPLASSSTVLVDADLVGKAAAAETPPATVGADEKAMASGASLTTVLELALALQVVIVALLLASWAWARWSRAAAWVVGVPFVVAALWFCSGIAARLLPNLL